MKMFAHDADKGLHFAGVVALGLVAILPDVTTLNDEFATWLFRGVLIASLMLNLHFLRKVYQKIASIDVMRGQIKTITKTLRYLSREGSEHNERRHSDSLIQDLLVDLADEKEQTE